MVPATIDIYKILHILVLKYVCTFTDVKTSVRYVQLEVKNSEKILGAATTPVITSVTALGTTLNRAR